MSGSVTYINVSSREEEAGHIKFDRINHSLLQSLLVHIEQLQVHGCRSKGDCDLLSHVQSHAVVLCSHIVFKSDCAWSVIRDLFELAACLLGVWCLLRSGCFGLWVDLLLDDWFLSFYLE